MTKSYVAPIEGALDSTQTRGTIRQPRSAEAQPRSAFPGYQGPARRESLGSRAPDTSQSWCRNCGRYQGLAEELVSGMAVLESELRRRVNVAPFRFDDSRRSLAVRFFHIFQGLS